MDNLGPTLDQGVPYPCGPGMGDVLPPKRQTVVDRLRRRLELYRRHQGSCLPRYDQAANGICDAQRHETQILKQRFLEAKAKKTKRNDNRQHTNNARENNANNTGVNIGNNNNNKNSAVTQTKIKRPAGSPLLDCAIDGLGDGHPSKIPRNSTPDHYNNGNSANNVTNTNNNNNKPAGQQQSSSQPGMQSFSVQIVQQFTNTSQAPHSQTIQTNVTVQTLSGGAIKTANSPLTTNNTVSASPSGNNTDVLRSNAAPGGGNNVPGSTSISVGTSIECKQEPDLDFVPCSVNCGPMTDLDNANGNQNAQVSGDRFSDSLANLGFPEDSSDDVIHPDILKDIIDDVFTNPSDLMNGFSFVDNMKDNSSSNFCSANSNLLDDKDALRNIMNNGKLLNATTSSQMQQHQSMSNSMMQFNASQSQQSVFDFQQANPNSSQLSQNANSSFQQQQGRMSQYVPTSPNLANNNNNAGIGLDFKLTEPSPAAQTLKQMAEQHQNMQQKQQQLGLAIGQSHPRSPYGSDSFPDPLSTMRSTYLNGSPNTMNTAIQKSPNNMFQPMAYNQQQQNFAGNTVAPSVVKQEIGSPVPPMYSSMNPSPVQMSELEMHKRRQQVLQMQQQQQQQQHQQQQRPTYSPNPNDKSMCSQPFQGTKTLSHYNDSLAVTQASHRSASNSPISHPGQFIRGVATPGVTPSPPTNYGSSPSPSGATLHLTQSQQLQISQSNQQLQVSQSQQQQLLVQQQQDMKPTLATQSQQQQQLVQSRNFYPGHQSTIHMSQTQSANFQFNGNSVSSKAQQRPPCNVQQQQRQMPQFAGRPPPEYQQAHDQSMAQSMVESRVAPTPGRGRKAQYNQNVNQSGNPMIMSTMPQPTPSGRGRGKARGGANKQSYPRQQRPPNVNVGPEGLNISQRPPPTAATDWRQLYVQQQQQVTNIRIPYARQGVGGTQKFVQNNPQPNYHHQGLTMNPNVHSAGNLPRELMNMPQVNQAQSRLNNSHMVTQQQQQQQHQTMMQHQSAAETINAQQLHLLSPGAMSSALDQHHNMFINSPKNHPMKVDLQQHSLTQDNNEFILDFLDNIDCSASDLLNFDNMPPGSADFPLIDDIGLLGK